VSPDLPTGTGSRAQARECAARRRADLAPAPELSCALAHRGTGSAASAAKDLHEVRAGLEEDGGQQEHCVEQAKPIASRRPKLHRTPLW
jgi:hypothetical protein